MKLLTIELLFDGENLIITPHSAFSNLLNLIKSHNVEMMSPKSNFLLQNFIDSLSDKIFISYIRKYRYLSP